MRSLEAKVKRLLLVYFYSLSLPQTFQKLVNKRLDMRKKILIDSFYPEEIRVATIKNNILDNLDYETTLKKQIKGNIYLAKITRVEPSLQAAFVDYGSDKQGFLPFSEIHYDYFNIPEEDKQKISQEITERSQRRKGTEADVAMSNVEQIAYESKIDTPEHAMHGLSNDVVEDNIRDDDRFESFASKYKIQDVIKKNQVVLVQVSKEERGNKGVTLTTYITLAGRYCVLMANTKGKNGVSKRISDGDHRRKARDMLDKLSVPDAASVIIRTAGINRSENEIKRDYEYLLRLWNNIRENTLKSKAPTFIHAEGDVIKRTIRDLYDDTISEIIVQGKDAFHSARDFMKLILPDKIDAIKEYDHKIPLFTKFNIDEQIYSLFNPISYLDSGAYVVIVATEALVAIDVNSGKATSERNVEETAYRTNIEAAKEIARQIRLRDLSGIIVIDFIDMKEDRHKRAVEKVLIESLYDDKARIQMGGISPFGLVEMSRQRLKSSFIETNTVSCNTCRGKGYLRAPETTANMILRTVESEICKGSYEMAGVYANAEVITYILNNKRSDIQSIEQKYGAKIGMYIDHEEHGDAFSVEKVRKAGASKEHEPEPLSSIEQEDLFEAEEPSNTHANKGGNIEEIPMSHDDAYYTSRSVRYKKRGNNRNRFNKKKIRKTPQGAPRAEQNDNSGKHKEKPVAKKSLLKGILSKILD